MMSRTSLLRAVSPILAACASGAPRSEVAPVPVFFSEAEAPCAYEVVGRAERDVTVDSDMERAIRHVMGEGGARAGADAVLVDQDEQLGTVRVRGSGAPSPSRQPVIGQLLFWTEEGCGG